SRGSWDNGPSGNVSQKQRMNKAPNGDIHILSQTGGDVIQMNMTSQAQLEDYTIRSHLAADLIYRSAAPILEAGLPASARKTDKCTHTSQILYNREKPQWTYIIYQLGSCNWESSVLLLTTRSRGATNQTPEI
ncbi:MAG: hypothetical protein EZS28_050115, partial [Streblomastix strix]